MILEFAEGIAVLTSSLTEIIHSGVNLGMGTFSWNGFLELFRGG
jgi:hypothetical protein